MKITKFEALSTIMGRERVVSYDGARLCIEAAFEEVAGMVQVFEALVLKKPEHVEVQPEPVVAAHAPTPAPEPVREPAKTKTRKVEAQPLKVVEAPAQVVTTAEVTELPPTPQGMVSERTVSAEPDPHPGIDQPYEEPVKAAVEVVASNGDTTAVNGTVGYTCDEEDIVSITGFNTMRKVLDHLRAKYKFETPDQFVAVCETVMDTASPIPPLLERVGRDNLRQRIETALAASRGA